MKSASKYSVSVQAIQRILITVVCGVLCTIILTSCSYINTPSYEETECQFYTESARDIECGILKVPEDRSKEDSPMIELHFAIVKSNDPDKAPEPILVLNGGPGLSSLAAMDNWLHIFQYTLYHRDVIVLDQRGVGYSQPSLNCPELEAPFYSPFAEDLSTVEQNDLYIQALQSCRERLEQEQINLSVYNSGNCN